MTLTLALVSAGVLAKQCVVPALGSGLVPFGY